MMKKLLLLLLASAAASCAHRPEVPRVVQFLYAEELLREIQVKGSRAPASFEESMSDKSSRRVYFSALYQQYLTLGKYIGSDIDLKTCPQFHHDKILTDGSNRPQVSFTSPRHLNQEGLVFFPEFAFNEEFSLSDYLAVLRAEIYELCEDGSSDNYFKFDNLVTHFAERSSFHVNPNAMTAVLKIPVFANFYLVKMLEVPGHTISSKEERELISLTKTHWFESYVAEASRQRNSLLNNKMVRR